MCCEVDCLSVLLVFPNVAKLPFVQVDVQCFDPRLRTRHSTYAPRCVTLSVNLPILTDLGALRPPADTAFPNTTSKLCLHMKHFNSTTIYRIPLSSCLLDLNRPLRDDISIHGLSHSLWRTSTMERQSTLLDSHGFSRNVANA